MNDPNATTDGLIEALETEYMELAAAGDFKAIDYALAESEQFNAQALSTLMALMRVTGPESSRDPEFGDKNVTIHMQGARCDLLEVLTQHVAPAWALQEYDRRRQEAEEMAAEWQESEWREVA